MTKTLLAAVLIMLNISAQAAPGRNDGPGSETDADGAPVQPVPKKTDAENWLAEFSAARDKTGDPLFLKNFEKRQTHTRTLRALREQAEKLFGDVVSQYGDCTKAVEAVNGYWQTEIALITDPANNQTIKAGGIVASAWQGGIAYASCLRLIDGLK